jgi:hypothetical protein
VLGFLQATETALAAAPLRREGLVVEGTLRIQSPDWATVLVQAAALAATTRGE